MVDDIEQLNLLKQGVNIWNQWRDKNLNILPMLQHANLSESDLNKANLSKADLRYADLSFADLSDADLSDADLSEAKLSGAKLNGTNLCGANLTNADLSCANVANVNLSRACLIHTNLARAVLIDSLIYGISAWDVQIENAWQNSLTITSSDQPTITVDNLEIAQFVYLLLNNRKAVGAIDTISTKIVLVLGRFLPERKPIVDAISTELRKRNYLPILFDFNRPHNWEFVEMLSTLAHLSHFIIADFTDASIPQELLGIIPRLHIPIQPLMSNSTPINAVVNDLYFYPWVLPIHRYESSDDLLLSLNEHVIEPSEKAAALR